ncbi:MAG: UDP-N-acetylglucosamine--LPS N-acetylglucosamine transferase [Myxococcales bacterium FL481]|nr:MAG: UDP-N-acetylglucosamine--LPS N-acetylglucosamine transferase [Myxococcales bacterium FL481]
MRPPKLALVASSGGHLAELFALKDLWESTERFWVSFPTQDAQYLLADERVIWASYPTNRNLPNLARNARLALGVLRRERPDAVISTGAGVGVPFLWAGRLFGLRTVYVESITRLGELSLSGRLVYPVVDKFLVQWEGLTKDHPKAEYWGQVV